MITITRFLFGSITVLLGLYIFFTFLNFSNICFSLVYEFINQYKDKIILIEDCIVSNNSQSIKELRNINEIKDDEIGFDVGPKTIDIYKEILKDANTIFFNGPLGLFENKEFETAKRILNEAFNVCAGNTEDKLIGATFEQIYNKLLDVL